MYIKVTADKNLSSIQFYLKHMGSVGKNLSKNIS